MENPLRYEPDVKLSRLRPNPYNPRHHPPHEIDMLMKNMQHFGFLNPILAQANTGNIIAGHGRLKAAIAAGLETVPVMWWEVNDEDAQAHTIADNRIGSMSEWNIPLVKDALARLDGNCYPIERTGFSDMNIDVLLSTAKHVSFLVESKEADEDKDEVKDPSVKDVDAARLVFVLTQPDRHYVFEYLKKMVNDTTIPHTAAALVALIKEHEAEHA